MSQSGAEGILEAHRLVVIASDPIADESRPRARHARCPFDREPIAALIAGRERDARRAARDEEASAAETGPWRIERLTESRHARQAVRMHDSEPSGL